MASNIEAAHQLTAGCNAGDATVIAGTLGDDAVMLTAQAGARFDGAEAITQALMAWVGAFDGFTLETVREFFSDDLGYNEWVMKGTNAQGEAVQTHGVDFLKFKDGRIVEKSSFKKV